MRRKLTLILGIVFLLISLSGCGEGDINKDEKWLYMISKEANSGKIVRYGLINNKGEIVVKPEFDEIKVNMFSATDSDLIIVRKNEKYGYINKKGEVIVEPKFEELTDFKEGLALAKLDGKYGFIDKNIKWVVKPKFQSATIFSEGTSAVKLGDMWGFIDKKGNWIIKPRFTMLTPFVDGICEAQEKFKRKEFMSKSGKIITDKYDDFKYCRELVGVKLNNKWGAINKEGKMLVKPQFEEIGNFQNDSAPIKNNGKWGVVNKQGEVLLEPKYDYVMCLEGSLIGIKENNKWTIIDKNTKAVINSDVEHILNTDPKDGIFYVELNGKWGILDEKGKWIRKAKFSDMKNLKENLDAPLAVKSNNKWGFVDKNDKFIIEAKFDEAYPFIGDLACVIKDGDHYYINKKGEIVKKCCID